MWMVTPQSFVSLAWPHFQLNCHSIKAFWGQMLEDIWAWGPFCGLVFSLGITKVLFFQSPILNIDIAPTIVELAGGKAPESMDGRSILPLLVCSFEPLFTFFFSSFVVVVICRCLRALPKSQNWPARNISVFSEFVLKLTTTVHTIEHFHSPGQHLC